MSKINLTPNASGTGVFTIASPNSNTDRTLTLPDESGTILTTSSSVGVDGITSNATSTAVTLDSNGNVGIGTSSPAAALDVFGQVSVEGTGQFGIFHAGSAGPVIGFESGSNLRIGTVTSKTASGFAEAMRIDSSGKLLSAGGSAFVGTVATGSTQGSIIERGSNSNGEYIKFADGTMICTFHGTAVTGSYARVTWSYPQAFLNSVIATTTTNYKDGGDIRGRTVGVSEVYSSSSTRFIYKGVGDSDTSSIPSNLTINVQHFAIGRWY